MSCVVSPRRYPSHPHDVWFKCARANLVLSNGFTETSVGLSDLWGRIPFISTKLPLLKRTNCDLPELPKCLHLLWKQINQGASMILKCRRLWALKTSQRSCMSSIAWPFCESTLFYIVGVYFLFSTLQHHIHLIPTKRADLWVILPKSSKKALRTRTGDQLQQTPYVLDEENSAHNTDFHDRVSKRAREKIDALEVDDVLDAILNSPVTSSVENPITHANKSEVFIQTNTIQLDMFMRCWDVHLNFTSPSVTHPEIFFICYTDPILPFYRKFADASPKTRNCETDLQSMPSSNVHRSTGSHLFAKWEKLHYYTSFKKQKLERQEASKLATPVSQVGLPSIWFDKRVLFSRKSAHLYSFVDFTSSHANRHE